MKGYFEILIKKEKKLKVEIHFHKIQPLKQKSVQSCEDMVLLHVLTEGQH